MSEKDTEKMTESMSEQIAEKVADKVKDGRKRRGRFVWFLRGALIGLLIGAVVASVLSVKILTRKPEKEEPDFSAEFVEALLGEAKENCKLIVMEQPIELTTTILQEGLFNWDITRKSQVVVFSGTGTFTVDLENMKSSWIDVDKEAKEVRITIPHAVLNDVKIDHDRIRFYDTEKGFLAFGQLTLTPEDQNVLYNQVTAKMWMELKTDELFAKADEFAAMECWKIFRPVVNAISREYSVVIEFQK